VVSQHDGGPAYGGTPSDEAVVAAIADLRRRGLKVTLYPIVLMDIPAGNPMGQPAYPWRGRIAAAPGSDGTGAAAVEVAAFAAAYRAFIRHYAELAVAAGGVEAFLIGSELRGLTFTRGADDTFPFVAALVSLAAEVRAVVGAATKLTYAADWSEYAGVQPGGGAKFFHLDPLWAAADIDAVGIDNYMPVTDWRVGPGPYDLATLGAGIAGGEGFDWYYASDADRQAGTRTPITDADHGEPWVWRFKDLASWWTNAHHDRPGGVRAASPTAWVPRSKPAWFTELGCAAIDRGANQPNVFLDAKSAESFTPYFSNGVPDALQQRQVLRAALAHWAGSDMVERVYLWTWDARPYPAFPMLRAVWSDGANHATGHWLTGRLGGLAGDELLRAIAADYGVTLDRVEAQPPFVHGYVLAAPMTARQALEPVLALSGLGLRDGVAGLCIGRADGSAALAVDEVVAGAGPLLSRRRPDPGEAIGQVALSYADRERDYLDGAVTAITQSGGALDAVAADMVLDLGGARRAAERLLAERNGARETLELTLPPSQAALEVGDSLACDGALFEVTEIRDGLARRVTARAILPELAVAFGAERAPPAGTAPAPRALPDLMAAHLPPVPENPAQTRLALGAFARPWPGTVEVCETHSGTVLARLPYPATTGTLAAPLGPGTLYTWDEANALKLTLASGHLASRDEAEVLAGANRLAVEADSGAWEIVGFAAAELVAPGAYRLTRLLRGQDGTDHAIGLASAGQRVLLLDTRVTTLGVPPAWLGATAGLTSFAGPDDGEGVTAPAALDLAPLLPLRPVHLHAARQANGDVEIGWVRRSRADSGSWVVEEVPLDWAPEAYRVEIEDGGTVLRRLEVSAPAATYTAAQQSADFGGAPAAFTFRVAQLSAAFGPGHWARGEVNA
jgi:hypothetical protein